MNHGRLWYCIDCGAARVFRDDGDVLHEASCHCGGEMVATTTIIKAVWSSNTERKLALQRANAGRSQPSIDSPEERQRKRKLN